MLNGATGRSVDDPLDRLRALLDDPTPPANAHSWNRDPTADGTADFRAALVNDRETRRRAVEKIAEILC